MPAHCLVHRPVHRPVHRRTRFGVDAFVALVLLSTIGTSLGTASVTSSRDRYTASITEPGMGAAHFARVQKANALLDGGDHTSAIGILEELVAAAPSNGELWNALGYARYHAGEYARAAEAYTHATDIGIAFVATTIYNLACCQALSGDVDGAVASLRRALAAGFENRPLIREDTDLVALHDHASWVELAGLLPAEVAALGRDAGWRYDLRFWRGEVLRLHPAPFDQVDEAAFEARVAELHDRIPQLSDEQITIELQKLTVLLGDGHSGIRPMPGSRVQMRRLPLQLYSFAEGLFVIGTTSGRADLVGSEVLRIGDREVADLWPGLPALVSRDNAMGLLDMGPLLLTTTTILRDLDAIGDTEEVPLRLRGADGDEYEVTLASEPMRSAHRELVAPASPQSVEPPLFLAREHEVFWFDALSGIDGGLFVQFNVVRNAPDASVADYASRLRDHLQAHPKIDVIALDLRHNGGGNSFLYPPLVRVLVEYQLERPDARLYVLTGRRTFSACQNLATDLDFWTDAIFAGEPTGSRPNQIGESTYSQLPYSGLRAGISSRFHQQSYPGDDRPWIAPDIPVAFTAAAYFSGRDPVLEAVVAAEAAR